LPNLLAPPHRVYGTSISPVARLPNVAHPAIMLGGEEDVGFRSDDKFVRMLGTPSAVERHPPTLISIAAPTLLKEMSMNERQYRFFMNQALFYTRSISNEPLSAGRRMSSGKICRSCKSPLPVPHTCGAKLCGFCAERHLVYMYFRYNSIWFCGFRTESRKKLPRELTFGKSASVREIARRGNGLIDKWDIDGFELGLEMGRGGVWLRLNDDQYRVLGGVL